MEFNSEQKSSGFNEHGHYQFGSLTCVYCKNDDTDFKDGRVYCSACTAEFTPKRDYVG